MSKKDLCARIHILFYAANSSLKYDSTWIFQPPSVLILLQIISDGTIQFENKCIEQVSTSYSQNTQRLQVKRNA